MFLKSFILKRPGLALSLIISAVVVIPFLVNTVFGALQWIASSPRDTGEANQSVSERVREIIAPSNKIKVYFHKDDSVKDMDFEEYLVGVLTGEMPASYEPEALKAQCVAARSYILSRMEYYKNAQSPSEHKGADICTDPGHCKAWIGTEEGKAKWGEQWADEYLDKMKLAVNSTRGEYLVYENQIVKAFFYSTSGGKTERVEDVWGGDAIPYLRSVPSVGDETAPNFETSVEVSSKDFVSKLKSANSNVKESSPPGTMIGACERTEGGSVASITLGGVKFKGTEIRSIFNLRSANFSIQSDNQSVIFHVKGYGHGVGMSQYGANYLAGQGKNYEEILKTYYTGVELSILNY